jgi:surface antigen
MLNRECVSYTAWRASAESSVANALLQEYSFGNAGDWPANAKRYGSQYGVTVSLTPQVGDIAIRPAIAGAYVAPGDPDVGHAMYVEGVNGDGSITVSEYNEYLDGTYSEEIRSTSGYYHGAFYQLQFIRFP